MTNSDAWGVTIKVPEEVRDEVRQIVQEQAPGGTTYGDCLLAGAKALAQKNEIPPGFLAIQQMDTDELEELKDKIRNVDLGYRELERGWDSDTPDAEEIAAEVWTQADYAELSEQVARRVTEELQR